MSVEISDEKFMDITEKMFKEKSKGNDHFKLGHYDAAAECYKNAIDTGEGFIRSLKATEEQINALLHNSYYQKFVFDLKFCYSNLAAVYVKQNRNQECIEIDKLILGNFDPNFEKSYVRLITMCKKIGDTENAHKYLQTMSQLFSKDIIEKYKDQLNSEHDKKEVEENVDNETLDKKLDGEELHPINERNKFYLNKNNKLDNKEIKKQESVINSTDKNKSERIKNPYIRRSISLLLALILSFLIKKFVIDAYLGSYNKDINREADKNITIYQTKNGTQ